MLIIGNGNRKQIMHSREARNRVFLILNRFSTVSSLLLSINSSSSSFHHISSVDFSNLGVCQTYRRELVGYTQGEREENVSNAYVFHIPNIPKIYHSYSFSCLNCEKHSSAIGRDTIDKQNDYIQTLGIVYPLFSCCYYYYSC